MTIFYFSLTWQLMSSAFCNQTLRSALLSIKKRTLNLFANLMKRLYLDAINFSSNSANWSLAPKVKTSDGQSMPVSDS